MAFVPAFETARRVHEDYERLLHLGADALCLSRGGLGEHIPEEHAAHASTRAAEHLAAALVRSARSRGLALAQLYADQANKPPAASSDIAGALSEFYERLRELKAAHRSAEDTSGLGGSTADAALLAEIAPAHDFSGEESGGRYLDLQPHHGAYVNLLLPHGAKSRSGAEADDAEAPRRERPSKRARPLRREDNHHVDYVEYVKKTIQDYDSVPGLVRGGRPYERYLRDLLHYLVGFCERLYPLLNVSEMVSEAEDKLRADAREALVSLQRRYDSAESLLAGLGSNGVRDKLARHGLKCGGRPMDRAERLWKAISSPSFPIKEVKSSGFASALERDSGFGTVDTAVNSAASRTDQYVLEAAEDSTPKSTVMKNDVSFGARVFLEGLISHVLKDMLADELRATILNVEKKQSLSWAELEAERLAEESIAERGNVQDTAENAVEEEKPLYNPKDVPLGWDGKPIPFWLYKLHGLNHEFRCEICGGTTYKGPRAFERHFTDAQHVHGLRCLDITYSKQFYMVTRIADAVKLRDKLREDAKKSTFNADLEVEYEDKEGNVLNRKTYRDLERQGLLS